MPDMINVRRAEAADVDELVRLRAVMQEAIGMEDDGTDSWRGVAAAHLREWLAGEDFAVFVVERPDEPGRLAACAVGTVHRYLGSPWNPSGRVGYIYSVSTDEAYRRRGYSRACVTALLDWYRALGLRAVDLHASVDGEPLYASLGFERREDPSMRLAL